jgi:hypothetical protein
MGFNVSDILSKEIESLKVKIDAQNSYLSSIDKRLIALETLMSNFILGLKDRCQGQDSRINSLNNMVLGNGDSVGLKATVLINQSTLFKLQKIVYGMVGAGISIFA